MEQLIRRAAEALLNLGITSREVIEPRVLAWINRPPDFETHDEDSELAGFLTELFKDKIINRSQGRTLLAMLTERAPPPADDPYVGRRFGSYIAEERVGEGAMGKVYRATREGTLERNYVVKVFDQTTEENAVRRFRREGDVMSKLDHPNIVKVMGSGQEGGAAFLVLEFCEGPTLAEMLLQRGKFSWKSAARAIKQIASALAAAHEKGVIHRDIKPQNILVAPGGMLKVFDFGLAKTLDSKSSSLSLAGEILGSPAFMAPEQWGDHQVDERADLFSVGVIFYLLITGETPFKGRTPADYSWKIREGTYPPVSELVPEVPLGVQHVIDQLLERDRAWRTPSASRLISSLDRILHNKPPNLPRLELIDAENTISKRYFLVAKPSYRIGNDFEVEVFADVAGMQAEHARLDRSEGILLTAQGKTLVNGKEVREIVLRDKDLIVFGEGGATFRYRVGNLGRRTSSRVFDPSSDRFERLEDPAKNSPGPPVTVSGLLVSALAPSAHPRTMVHCFEGLDPSTIEAQLEGTGARLLRAGFSQELVDQVLERANKHAQESVWKVADSLFTRTKENLGRSVEAWLQWWFEVRHKYPPQFMAPVSRATGELKVRPNPDEDSFVFDLLGSEDWVIGRSDDCELTVKERSVSRQHLRLHRLNCRYAYVDLGSRFGTTIGENRVSVGLLRDGDALRLGRAKLRFKDQIRATAPQVGSGAVEVDEHSFHALVDVRSPAVVLTLIRLLDTSLLAQFCAQAVAPHEPPEKTGNVITAFLAAQREVALEALPAITKTNLGAEAGPWQQWWQANHAGLGPQVEPSGWGRES